MAIILPALHSKNLKLTSGERRFGTCLLRNLENDYHCWVDVPVGPKQRRPDFIVLHPGRGILVLEVKDWKLQTIKQMDRLTTEIHTDRGLKTVVNPLEQARAYAIEITGLLERDPLLVQQEQGRYYGHLLLPWGFGVVFTNISRKQFEAAEMDQAIPRDKVICQDEMTESVDAEVFQKSLWKMFNYSFGGILSLARIDRVRWHLFPKIRIQQGNLFDAASDGADPQHSIAMMLPDMVKIMDLEQEKLARNLGEGHRIIHGVAGSGKTLILAYRAMCLDKLGFIKPILILCYNKMLAAKLKQLLVEKGAGDRVHVRHFHGWCKDMCDLYQLDLPSEQSQPIYERQVAAVILGCEKGRVPLAQYAAVLIDEGQDFKPEWFKLLVQMIDPETNSLLLMYDDVQNIYGGSKRRVFTWSSVGINASGRSTILKVNYRNTIEALDFSYQFIYSYLDQTNGTEEIPLVHPEFGGRKGAKPEVYRLANSAQELKHVASWLKKRAEAGISYCQMTVLCRFKYQVKKMCEGLAKEGIAADSCQFNGQHTKAFDTAKDTVKVLTMHSSKGLEFNSVVIPDLGCMPYAKTTPAEEARLLYVALTRSTESLLMTYHSESPYTKQCEALHQRKELSSASYQRVCA
ncbi:DNA helicase [Candidatus Nitrotoga sp. BS]|uniref:DEAD/DEAH box helicase n=1 Tax=Candidatus Nitrotoga sp. BS TaxID=2890408 RepID=UPI001EF21181|nr:nuclease-related domain-containing DEAD/DEAH box helicase [Candidatus Nitrotoga sp. BS]CAH1209676.1 DNA helicase [Candidatus Nitrotoga sp. BS]